MEDVAAYGAPEWHGKIVQSVVVVCEQSMGHWQGGRDPQPKTG